jgi:hypothetical protein
MTRKWTVNAWHAQNPAPTTVTDPRVRMSDAGHGCDGYFRTVSLTGLAFDRWTVPLPANDAVTLYLPGFFR